MVLDMTLRVPVRQDGVHVREEANVKVLEIIGTIGLRMSCLFL